MTAKQLFDAGRVQEAIAALGAYLRDHPTDTAQRTFLFELLCFAGQYDRAEKQLHVLAQGGGQAEVGAVLYFSAVHGEKTRHELFEKAAFPASQPQRGDKVPGSFNGKAFQTIRDADPDIGPRLEVFAAGAYLWIPFEHISSLEMGEPKRLRDTLWAPAAILTGPSFKGTDLGEVMIPVVYPFSWKHPEENVWLGRSTAWGADDQGREYPLGQKILVVDDEEIPLLELRSLKFTAEEEAAEEEEVAAS
jgi:type VI secretion system protein ImpE